MTKSELLSRLHTLTEWFQIFAGDLRDLAIELEGARFFDQATLDKIVCERLGKFQRHHAREQATRELVGQATRPRNGA